MASRTVTVGSSVGLHARPAAVIARAVGESGAAVTIATVGGDAVDAGSALLLMTLGAKHGDKVTVSSDDEDVLDRVARLVERDLDA
ncbi:MAG: HPr family phosphocarrier protein [Actinomycetota bacterium]|nr:HPr family phosphocarrier protein [Actinomycetota bacterium]